MIYSREIAERSCGVAPRTKEVRDGTQAMKKLSAFLLLTLLPGSLLGRPNQNPQSHSLALTHVTVIDATGAPPKADMTVLVTDDRITAIGETGKAPVPKDARTTDATGKYLIPGLWDMHVHNTRDQSWGKTV